MVVEAATQFAVWNGRIIQRGRLARLPQVVNMPGRELLAHTLEIRLVQVCPEGGGPAAARRRRQQLGAHRRLILRERRACQA